MRVSAYEVELNGFTGSTVLGGDPGEGPFEAALEDLEGGIEVGDAGDPLGAGLVAVLGDEADELAICDGGAVTAGQIEDAGVDLAHGRGAVVGDVHANLSAAVG